MNPFAVDGDLMAELPLVNPKILTEVFVNVHRYPDGTTTACQHKTVQQAEFAAKSINSGMRRGRVIARVRVPFYCVEGQFDV